jgi:hypothetical protein
MIPNESDWNDLTERLRILEQRSRRTRNAIFVTMLAVAGLLFAQQRQSITQERPPMIEAEQFVLKDANGAMRAVLGDEGDGPGLRLYGPEGFTPKAHPMAEFAVAPGGSQLLLEGSTGSASLAGDRISLLGQNGAGTLFLDVNGGNGSPTIELLSPQKHLEAVLYGEFAGKIPALVLFDKGSQVVWKAP